MTLNRPFTLAGARNRAHLHLVSSSVSKCHAAIIHDNGRVYIRDLSSRTHVYVNGRIIHEMELSNGDLLQIGSFTFKVQHPSGGTVEVPAPPPGQLVEINNGGGTLPLEGRTTVIGRRSGCDLHIEDESVSTIHAIVFELDGIRFVRDLGSRTGTFVNGVAAHQQPLNFNDRLRVGPREFIYRPAESDAGSFEDISELEDLVGTARLGHDEQIALSPTGRQTVAEPGVPVEDGETTEPNLSNTSARGNGRTTTGGVVSGGLVGGVVAGGAAAADSGLIPLDADDDLIPFAPETPRGAAAEAPAEPAPEPVPEPIDLDAEEGASAGAGDTVSLNVASQPPLRPSISPLVEDLSSEPVTPIEPPIDDNFFAELAPGEEAAPTEVGGSDSADGFVDVSSELEVQSTPVASGATGQSTAEDVVEPVWDTELPVADDAVASDADQTPVEMPDLEDLGMSAHVIGVMPAQWAQGPEATPLAVDPQDAVGPESTFGSVPDAPHWTDVEQTSAEEEVAATDLAGTTELGATEPGFSDALTSDAGATEPVLSDGFGDHLSDDANSTWSGDSEAGLLGPDVSETDISGDAPESADTASSPSPSEPNPAIPVIDTVPAVNADDLGVAEIAPGDIDPSLTEVGSFDADPNAIAAGDIDPDAPLDEDLGYLDAAASAEPSPASVEPTAVEFPSVDDAMKFEGTVDLGEHPPLELDADETPDRQRAVDETGLDFLEETSTGLPPIQPTLQTGLVTDSGPAASAAANLSAGPAAGAVVPAVTAAGAAAAASAAPSVSATPASPPAAPAKRSLWSRLFGRKQVDAPATQATGPAEPRAAVVPGVAPATTSVAVPPPSTTNEEDAAQIGDFDDLLDEPAGPAAPHDSAMDLTSTDGMSWPPVSGNVARSAMTGLQADASSTFSPDATANPELSHLTAGHTPLEVGGSLATSETPPVAEQLPDESASVGGDLLPAGESDGAPVEGDPTEQDRRPMIGVAEITLAGIGGHGGQLVLSGAGPVDPLWGLASQNPLEHSLTQQDGSEPGFLDATSDSVALAGDTPPTIESPVDTLSSTLMPSYDPASAAISTDVELEGAGSTDQLPEGFFEELIDSHATATTDVPPIDPPTADVPAADVTPADGVAGLDDFETAASDAATSEIAPAVEPVSPSSDQEPNVPLPDPAAETATPEYPAPTVGMPQIDPFAMLGRDQGSFFGGMPLPLGPLHPQEPPRPARPRLPFADRPVTMDTRADVLAEVTMVESESTPMFGAPLPPGVRDRTPFKPFQSDLAPLSLDDDLNNTTFTPAAAGVAGTAAAAAAATAAQAVQPAGGMFANAADQIPQDMLAGESNNPTGDDFAHDQPGSDTAANLTETPPASSQDDWETAIPETGEATIQTDDFATADTTAALPPLDSVDATATEDQFSELLDDLQPPMENQPDVTAETSVTELSPADLPANADLPNDDAWADSLLNDEAPTELSGEAVSTEADSFAQADDNAAADDVDAQRTVVDVYRPDDASILPPVSDQGTVGFDMPTDLTTEESDASEPETPISAVDSEQPPVETTTPSANEFDLSHPTETEAPAGTPAAEPTDSAATEPSASVLDTDSGSPYGEPTELPPVAEWPSEVGEPIAVPTELHERLAPEPLIDSAAADASATENPGFDVFANAPVTHDTAAATNFVPDLATDASAIESSNAETAETSAEVPEAGATSELSDDWHVSEAELVHEDPAHDHSEPPFVGEHVEGGSTSFLLPPPVVESGEATVMPSQADTTSAFGEPREPTTDQAMPEIEADFFDLPELDFPPEEQSTPEVPSEAPAAEMVETPALDLTSASVSADSSDATDEITPAAETANPVELPTDLDDSVLSTPDGAASGNDDLTMAGVPSPLETGETTIAESTTGVETDVTAQVGPSSDLVDVTPEDLSPTTPDAAPEVTPSAAEVVIPAVSGAALVAGAAMTTPLGRAPVKPSGAGKPGLARPVARPAAKPLKPIVPRPTQGVAGSGAAPLARKLDKPAGARRVIAAKPASKPLTQGFRPPMSPPPQAPAVVPAPVPARVAPTAPSAAAPTAPVVRPTPSAAPARRAPAPTAVTRDPFTNTGDLVQPAVPQRPSRKRLFLILLAVLITAGVIVAVWLTMGPRFFVEGRLQYRGLDTKISNEMRVAFQQQQAAALLERPVLEDARRQVLDKGMSLGFLTEGKSDESVRLSEALSAARWDERSGELIINYQSDNGEADRTRMLALLAAAKRRYDEAPRTAGDDAALARLRTRLGQIDVALSNIGGSRTTAQSQMAQGPERLTESTTLRQKADKLKADFEALPQKIRSLEKELTMLENLPSTAANAAVAADENDPELKRLTDQLKSLNESLTVAMEASGSNASDPKSILDEAQQQFDAQVSAARDAAAGNAVLAGYLERLQALQFELRRHNEELAQQQKDQREMLEKLRSRLAQETANRIQRAWDADPQLKAMVTRRAVVERQYNVASSAKLPEAKKLGDEMADLDKQIEALRGLIAAKDEYDPLTKQFLAFIDDSVKLVDQSRQRNEKRLKDLFEAFVAAKPDMDKLPADQQARAKALDEAYKSLSSARARYQAMLDETNARADSAVRGLTQQVASQQAKVDARKRELAEARAALVGDEPPPNLAMQEPDRLAAIELKRKQLNDARQSEAQLQNEWAQVSLAASRARAEADQAEQARSTIERLDAEQQALNEERHRINQQIDSASGDPLAAVTVGPIVPESATVVKGEDQRPWYAFLASMAGLVMVLMALAASRSPGVYIPPVNRYDAYPQEHDDGHELAGVPAAVPADPFSMQRRRA